MLYLAEVQKKSGFIGSGKAEFKLIACQRSEQNWSALPGDDIILAPDDASYSSGALVMIEFGGNRQIQRHYEAGRPLVSILQNFSSLSKKFKTQEDEIDQWKQSLTYQSQELNRREMELEARQEELEQAEADLEKVEAQRAELETARADVETVREEYARKNEELEGAWAHLNGELQKLEERQSESQSSAAGLDSTQTQQIQDALTQLTGTVVPTDDIRAQLSSVVEITDQQQSILNKQWQELEQTRASLAEQQAKLDEQRERLDHEWQSLAAAETALMATQGALQACVTSIEAKQIYNQALSGQLQQHSGLYQKLYALLNTSDKVRLSKKVDVAALEAMAIDSLQSTVEELEKDLDKMSRFVNDQEEELKLQQQAIDDLKGKSEAASEYDRLQLEAEISEEQDRHRMLEETLIGQRRNLLEREEVLDQHRAVLSRRQGVATEELESTVDSAELGPVLESIDVFRQQLSEQSQSTNDEISRLQAKRDGLKQQITQLTTELSEKRDRIREVETTVMSQQIAHTECQSRIAFSEACLQPVQDRLDEIRGKLDEFSGLVSQCQEASDYQLQSISEMRQTVQSLVSEPVAAAS